MRWNKIKRLPTKQFNRVVGIKKTTAEKLIDLLKPDWNARRKSGGAKPKLGLEDQLLLALSYWRQYGTYLETGARFGVSESAAWTICRWVEDSLKKKKVLHLPGKKELLKSKDKPVIFDVTECPIERPKRKKYGRRKNRQKNYYSGKKKRHTIKQQICISGKKIISTQQDCGKTHDFKIYKKSKNHVHPDTKVQTDLGYQGIQKIHANSELPKKRTKKNPLTKEDKKKNREISSERVVVEHVFAFLKKFKIISQRYRNRRKRFGLRFNLICGIFNYEWNE
jgi:hypothetical protein